MQNHLLYIGNTSWGLDVFDMRDPLSPIQTAFSREIETPLAIQGAWIYGKSDKNLKILYMDNYSEQETIQDILPTFDLYQNYPNPFNISTTIKFVLSKRDFMHVELFNLLGQHIKTLEKKTFDSGFHYINWDGRDKFGSLCATGLYICRFITNEEVRILKIIKLN